MTSYFSSKQWEFRNDAVMNLWDRMNPADREIFDFNLDNLDWDSCIKHMIRGIRLYFINDPMDTLEQGRAKYRK